MLEHLERLDSFGYLWYTICLSLLRVHTPVQPAGYLPDPCATCRLLARPSCATCRLLDRLLCDLQTASRPLGSENTTFQTTVQQADYLPATCATCRLLARLMCHLLTTCYRPGRHDQTQCRTVMFVELARYCGLYSGMYETLRNTAVTICTISHTIHKPACAHILCLCISYDCHKQ